MLLAYDNYAKYSTSYLKELAELAKRNNAFDTELYNEYNVKKGLRNKNGTGVLVGLTGIGDVVGYRMEDGNKIPVDGELYYRGYGIDRIVSGFQKEKRFGFEEVCYLLIFGQLPDKDELRDFQAYLGDNRVLPDGFVEDMVLKVPSPNIMNKLARSVLALYCYDRSPEDNSVANIVRQSLELLAYFPAMVAYAYQAKSRYYDSKSLFIHSPQPNLSTAENLLYMLRPTNEYTRLEAELLDLVLVLHAEHGGGNNSTFTTRVVTSADTDTYSAIAAAIGSLKGSKHGGANIKVYEMMENVKENVRDWEDDEEIKAYLRMILEKKAYDKSGLIYGMGHAVYTLSDPRAVQLKKKAEELAKAKGLEKEYRLFNAVEKLSPAVFGEISGKEKLLCANVDLYSGLVYRALGIPRELFTPLFATARIASWCAHRIEEIVSGGRIIRPAYRNILGWKEYVSLAER